MKDQGEKGVKKTVTDKRVNRKHSCVTSAIKVRKSQGTLRCINIFFKNLC